MMMRRLKRLAVVLGAVLAVIGLVRLVEHFGKAGDPEGELAALGGEVGGERFDPGMVWLPLLELAAVPRVVGVETGGGAVADGLVLGVGERTVVGYRGGAGRVEGVVYGGGAVGLGEVIVRGRELGGAFLGGGTGFLVGEGLKIAESGEVFLRNRGGGSSPDLLSRPLPGGDGGGARGVQIEPMEGSPEAGKP